MSINCILSFKIEVQLMIDIALLDDMVKASTFETWVGILSPRDLQSLIRSP